MSRTQSLNDDAAAAVAAAEGDLERLLAIEPSAEFAAKVRARIAAEAPVSRAWHWVRVVLPLAAAAAVILAMMLQGGTHGSDTVVPVTTVSHAQIVRHPPQRPATAGPTTPPGAIRKRAPRAAPPVAEAAEIIIDPSFAAAIRRMAVSPAQTALDPSLAGVDPIGGQPEALSIAEPLNLPQLVLKPADEAGGPGQ